MNYKTLSLCLSLACSLFALVAQAEDAAPVEEKVIPTEISEPPYEVGELVTESGYYIKRGEDETQINFRIVGNKLRVYWIDTDGLIAEPEAAVGTVRFTGSVRGRPYHRLNKLSVDAGLGAAGVVPPPHIFNVTLVIENPEDPKDLAQYSFRYVATMDQETDPSAATEKAAKSKY